jgi:dienelactone hydrolase
MIDHPVAPPYKGIDDMPVNRQTMATAISKLRELGKEVGLSGKIGVLGFSRGATMAAAVAGDEEIVQAALVHGNRFDYTQLRPDDPMLKRFEKAWGPLEANRDRWAAQGAMHYLGERAAPMFLNTSDTESAEYRDGLQKLSDRLTQLGVEHVYRIDTDGRGHRVTTDPKTLEQIMAFFRHHLKN